MMIFSILIVDDEPGMRTGTERILEDYRIRVPDFGEEIGFSVHTAINGREALDSLEREQPDILLLDYKLPDIHGLDILSRVVHDGKNVLTVMITAYASLEVAINATKNGAFDFLAKPFTPEELKNTVRKAAEYLYLERKAQSLEEEKRQVRFQFISVLAHELKSPLAAVENYLHIMADRISGDNISDYESMISRSLLRIDGMRKMIIDLLDLTHIESGQKIRSLVSVKVCDVIDDVLEKVKADADWRKISLTVACDGQLEFFCDRSEIDILITNLLTNAVKYNHDGGTVDLRIEPDGGNLRIICRDSGIGMTVEEAAGLFSEFYRVKNKLTKDILGSGLGLSIVRKIVNLYSGSIDVASVPGKGTEMSVFLASISPD